MGKLTKSENIKDIQSQTDSNRKKPSDILVKAGHQHRCGYWKRSQVHPEAINTDLISINQ